MTAHDVTEVRKEALRLLSMPHGEDHMVEAAMETFLSIRSNVAPHLYHDVLPCFEWLKSLSSHLQIGDVLASTLLLYTLVHLHHHISLYLHHQISMHLLSQYAHLTHCHLLSIYTHSRTYERQCCGSL